MILLPTEGKEEEMIYDARRDAVHAVQCVSHRTNHYNPAPADELVSRMALSHFAVSRANSFS